ncbi:hypothetical protein [Pseudomonas rhodesiae]|uniref:hypothetical protein n=1 Tax=Pseudomonas rhodesiae TaxID=76760 RepID=UPI0032B2EBE3
MLSTQPQACPPVRFPRLTQTALAGFISSLSQTALFEDSGSDEMRLLVSYSVTPW